MLKLGMKKALAVLLAVLFVVSLTAVAASVREFNRGEQNCFNHSYSFGFVGGSGHWKNNGYNRFRKLFIRCEKKIENYLALSDVAFFIFSLLILVQILMLKNNYKLL
jgi:hypothetical protein